MQFAIWININGFQFKQIKPNRLIINSGIISIMYNFSCT